MLKHRTMPNLKDVIARLCKVAGIPDTNEAVVKLLANESLTTIEVEPLTENLLNAGLMSKEAAKNNPDISQYFESKFVGATLGNVDSKLIQMLKELDIDEDTLSSIRAEEKTAAKFSLVKKAIADNLEKKGTSKKDKDALEDERKQLNAKILELQAEKAAEVAKAHDEFKTKLQIRDYESYLNQYDFATNEQLDRDSAKMLADMKVKKYLAEKGFTLQYNPDDAANMFKVVTTTGLDAFEGNTPVTFKGLTDKVIADNKLLKVSGTPENKNQQQQHQNNQQIIEGKKGNDFSAMAAEMDSQASQLKTQ